LIKDKPEIVLLAGGYGSRLGEYTNTIPKPMIKIGGYPIIIHIINIFNKYGFKNFIICTGYKKEHINRYFKLYQKKNKKVKIYTNDKIQNKNQNNNSISIRIVFTGKNTQTGGRIKRIKKYIKNDYFLMTYADGLSDINLNKLVKFHKKIGKLATVTAIKLRSKFGSLLINSEDKVEKFTEKPVNEEWINGGFFVLKKEIFKFIKDDSEPWEANPLKKICKLGELVAFKHPGFWRSMDTMKDKVELNKMWKSGKAKWKVW
tara:strand:- start:9074 stop:9853 length:780 start_codon:yes stop_codon:yes gene_type:complete